MISKALSLSLIHQPVCRVWHFSTRSPVCKSKIAGVQVCITTNFLCAGVHQTIVVKIWESYCTFLHFNDILETQIDEYFRLQNLFASRPIFLLLEIFKNLEYKMSKHGIGTGVQSKSRGHVLKNFPRALPPDPLP